METGTGIGTGRWTKAELILLHTAFMETHGMRWDDAVRKAATDRTVVLLKVRAATWRAVAERVQTRTAQQCASKLNADRVTMSHFGSIPDPNDPELTLPLVETPKMQAGNPLPAPRKKKVPSVQRLAHLVHLDISVYMGTPSGRIVWSADRAALILRADAFLAMNDADEG